MRLAGYILENDEWACYASQAGVLASQQNRERDDESSSSLAFPQRFPSVQPGARIPHYMHFSSAVETRKTSV